VAERRCKICNSSLVKQVDKAIIEGRTLQNIAEETGFHVSSLCRHKAHIAEKLTAYTTLTELQEGATLLQKVESLLQRAENLLTAAENNQDLRTAIAAVREVRGVLELMGRASGELDNDKVQVLIAPVINDVVAAVRSEIDDPLILNRISDKLLITNINKG